MPAANEALALLAACTLKAVVLLALAFAAAPLLRGRAAAVRHLAWASTLAAVLALPLLSLLAPPIRVALPTAAPAAPHPELRTVETRVQQPGLVPGGSRVIPRTTFGERRAEGPWPSPEVPWREALLSIWILGVAAVLGRLAVHLVRLRRVARRASAIHRAEWVSLLHELRTAAGITRRVRLLRGGVGVPVTWGTLRPVVLLPAECGRWTAERWVAVLAHELSHVRRLDALTLWAARLATALYWFLPPVWTAARRMMDEGERACDDAVLRAGTLPSAYATHLLDISRSAGARTPAAAALAMAGSRMERRVVAILDPCQHRAGVGRRGWTGACFAALAVTLPVAGLQAAPAVETRVTALAVPARGRLVLPTPPPGRVRNDGAVAAGPVVRGDRKPPAEPAASRAEDRPPADQSGTMPDAAVATTPPGETAAPQPESIDSAIGFRHSHTDGLGVTSRLVGDQVLLSADGREIAALRPAGSVELSETGPNGSRTLVVLPGVDGRPEYLYRVNGAPAAMGPEVRGWLARELRAVRQ
ncbi:MAG TPA: M56 family metallopeptidase [Longimicrobiaceae bacterium]|nr:M56 family metallopeptidase [Longimicrobiaceae bacterium]